MSDTRNLEVFRAKFRIDDLIVLDTGAWSWSVRPSQPTLGSGIVSLNRYAPTLADVTAAEMAELAGLIRRLEGAVKTCFTHDIMNYLMLMMVDRQVHYHVIPRYAGPRRFNGPQWLDNGWPKLPVLTDSQHPEAPGALQAMRDALIGAVKAD